MKKITAALFILIAGVGGASAATEFNPFLGHHHHQVALYLGQGVDHGFIVPPPSRFVPFYAAQVQYSQPTTFFRLAARQSLNIITTIGMGKKYGWDWTDFTIPIAMVSEDIALLYGKNWYLSAGPGVGLQAQQNDRLGAKLLFQLKLSAGYRWGDHWGAEFYIQHMSNANTADENYSYAFYGLGMTYSF